jgi:hypothetical protein
MKHKILFTAAFTLALATVFGLTKFTFANSTPDLLPIADVPLTSGWTPSIASAPHYTMIDDSIPNATPPETCNGTLDYNYAAPLVPDEINYDHYRLDISSIPNGAVMSSVTVKPCASAHVLSSLSPLTSVLGVGFVYNNGLLGNTSGLVSYDLQGNNNTPTPLTPKIIHFFEDRVKKPTSTMELWVEVRGLAGARVSQIIANISYSYTATPTVGATSVVSTTPTSTGFYAYVNPNGTSTTGWFRYGSTSPGTCNDTFGTRVPAVAGINLGAGNSPVQYFYYNAPLSRDTIYYYCAVAENALGKSFGALKSFKTAP